MKTVIDTDDIDLLALFRREIEHWIGIAPHPNVVQAFAAERIASTLFVHAEYIEPDELGRNTVEHWVGGPVTDALLLKWISHFCYGLHSALNSGIATHRDIKPSNLMVDKHGILKISDFGLARPISSTESRDNSGTSALSRDHRAVTAAGFGSREYMAPERWVARTDDHRSDIYSFGVTLFELCTGGRPFVAQHTADLAELHLNAYPAIPESPFAGMIRKCLEKDPRRRYQSTIDILADLNLIAKRLGLTVSLEQKRPDVTSELLYRRAVSLSTLDRPHEAVEAAREYIARRPHDPYGWSQLGQLLLRGEQLNESEYALRRSLDLNPRSTSVWNNLGNALSHQKRWREALDAYRNAIAEDPTNAGAMLNAYTPLRALCKFTEARELLERAATLQPEKPAVWHNLGALCVETGFLALAEQHFLKALTLDPSLWESQEMLRRLRAGETDPDPGAMIAAGNLPAAREALTALTRQGSQDPDHWHNLGLIWANDGNNDFAMDCFKQALTLYGRLGQARQAAEECKLIVGLRATSERSVCIRAQALELLGRGEQAILELRQFIDGHPDADTAWFILANIFEKMGRPDAALHSALACLKLLNGASHRNENYRAVVDLIEQLTGRKDGQRGG